MSTSKHRKLFQRRPDELRAGQVWVPALPGTPGVSRARIICRYPFATEFDGPVWIVESADSFCRIERIPEKTLRELWRLESDVQVA